MGPVLIINPRSQAPVVLLVGAGKRVRHPFENRHAFGNPKNVWKYRFPVDLGLVRPAAPCWTNSGYLGAPTPINDPIT
ncbi:MAG TPA: hypothetical protein DDZ51_17410 [Planctomycetaceae bacterium]|nr:hypothetical protein [Planctomycetaceae bacterium]